jgi:hypothetical protein
MLPGCRGNVAYRLAGKVIPLVPENPPATDVVFDGAGNIALIAIPAFSAQDQGDDFIYDGIQ